MVGPAQTYKEKPRQNGWIIVPPTVPLPACSTESDSLNLCYRGPDRNVVLWWINHPMTSRWSDAKPWRRTAGPIWSISKSPPPPKKRSFGWWNIYGDVKAYVPGRKAADSLPLHTRGGRAWRHAAASHCRTLSSLQSFLPLTIKTQLLKSNHLCVGDGGSIWVTDWPEGTWQCGG